MNLYQGTTKVVLDADELKTLSSAVEILKEIDDTIEFDIAIESRVEIVNQPRKQLTDDFIDVSDVIDTLAYKAQSVLERVNKINIMEE